MNGGFSSCIAVYICFSFGEGFEEPRAYRAVFDLSQALQASRRQKKTASGMHRTRSVAASRSNRI
ncbi:MAG: hypothetical protein BLM47_08075 [Candidatus Reconcilbacillus cellulovorans]|uniref:Uncharacterized protein n=1 Tax=Candidatus Reconcilbacillus cellulovorans TaxID=1906605 RepID=A0A2A6E0F6_9BACL|nr:MAG: hypothetical protein BLM47_08075 [Candidatus Reconcilbacillus cellulovorans]